MQLIGSKLGEPIGGHLPLSEKERGRSKSVSRVYREAHMPRSLAKTIGKVQLTTKRPEYEKTIRLMSGNKPRSAISRSRGSLVQSRFGQGSSGARRVEANVYFTRNMSGKHRMVFNRDFDDPNVVVPLENVQIRAGRMVRAVKQPKAGVRSKDKLEDIHQIITKMQVRTFSPDSNITAKRTSGDGFASQTALRPTGMHFQS